MAIYKPPAGANIVDRASGATVANADGNTYYDLSAESGLGGNQYGPSIGDVVDTGGKTLAELNATSGGVATPTVDFFGNTIGDQAGTVAKAQATADASGATQYNTGSGFTTIAPISNPISSPTGGSTTSPTFPVPQAGNATTSYTQSLTSQIDQTKAAVQAEADKRAAEYQTKIDEITQQQKDLQTLQDAGMAAEGAAVAQETADKKAALELEKQRFDENYNANQALIGELDGLLTAGNEAIQQMKDTTGLASILNPRIAKTMSDVTARAGVIQAVLSARNSQMTYAQQQLGTTFDALSSITTDQVNYYNTLIDFYQVQKNENTNSILNLTKDQKDYLDVKLNMLNNDLTRLQATKDVITKAMLDPDTASQYAMAGVTMNDSVEQIGRKLAQYGYSQELKNTSNAMATAGYTSVPQAGVTPTVITDSLGNTKSWYKIPDGKNNTTTIVEAGGRKYSVTVDAQGQLISKVDIGAATTGANSQTTLNPGDIRIDAAGKTIASNPTTSVQSAQATTGNPGTRTPTTQELIDAYKANGGQSLTPEQIAKLYGTTAPTGTSTEKSLTTVGFPPNTTQTDINEIETALKSGYYSGQKIGNPIGSDGYIDPASYVQLMNYWTSSSVGGTKQAFLTKFPVKTYINPANTWVWGQLGIPNPYVKSTTTSSTTTKISA
jgi:YD repeat-containing protein